MILVIGGQGEDKIGFCINKFNKKNTEIDENKFYMLKNLYDFLKKAYYEKIFNSENEIMNYLYKFEIIIADEIGCGIVPMDKNDRYFRDFYGKICCEAAKKADIVVRIICGIEQILKGEIK